MSSADWIGTIGVGLLLIAFAFNLLKLTGTKSLLYLSLNFCGATLAGIASILIKYIPFIILEGVWVIVTLFALISLFKRGTNENS